MIKSQWRKHERFVRQQIIEWIRRGRSQPYSLGALAWEIANDKRCGFDLLEFNDKHQRVYLQRGVLDWMEKLVGESEAALKKQAEWERL